MPRMNRPNERMNERMNEPTLLHCTQILQFRQMATTKH
jgi:hypothetical protein